MATPNPQIPLEARQTVLDKIIAGDSFTAYEITLEVRRRLGPSIEVPHGIVNPIVQTMFSNGEMVGYSREPDKNFAVATPPFRYFQAGGRVAAPFLAPVAPAIDRSRLPAELRFNDAVSALVRNYGLAARNHHFAAGTPEEPFAVWLPARTDLVFRLRCFGAGLGENEVQQRFSLDSSALSEADRLWKTAYAYADEWQVHAFQSGTRTTYQIALDAALLGSVTKMAAVPSRERDGLEIEIAIHPRDLNINSFGRAAAQIYRYFRVAPRLHRLNPALSLAPPAALFEGTNWRLTDQSPLALVGDVSFDLLGFPGLNGAVGVELEFAPGELEPKITGEGLPVSPRNRAAIEAALKLFDQELNSQIAARIEATPDIWQAKVEFGRISALLSGYLAQLLAQNGAPWMWNGIAIESQGFTAFGTDTVTILQAQRDAARSSGIKTRRVDLMSAAPNAVVVFNDLGTASPNRARLGALFNAAPDLQTVYALSFVSDAAQTKFVREQNFESVPVCLLSSIPQPVQVKNSATPTRRATSRTPFDPTLHARLMPGHSLVADFETLGDADFAGLKLWARTAPLENANWPDFKRLYKLIEAKIWPPQGRFRWRKNEADLPPVALPTVRETELLGVLMGRLDALHAWRGRGAATPAPNSPSAETLAYMARRAARLLRFLRDQAGLSAARRELLAPLFCGLMQCIEAERLALALPFRLKLDEHPILSGRPELIARLWNDATLAPAVLHWAYDWLQTRQIPVEVTPSHVRRFSAAVDVDFTLQILPAALESGAIWPADFDLATLSGVLQGETGATAQNAAFLAQRNRIVTLFARFPALQISENWLRGSLGEVRDEPTMAWANPFLQSRARIADFELVAQLSVPLRRAFNAALVTAFPAGLGTSEWEKLAASSFLAPLLAPALREIPLSTEGANWLWSLEPAQREAWIGALGAAKFEAAFDQTLRERARALDWTFLARLSPSQGALFGEEVARAFATGVASEAWTALSQASPQFGLELLPLGAGFWSFLLPLDTPGRARWLDLVGPERAARDFAFQPSATFDALLENAAEAEFLGDAWLERNLSALAPDSETVLQLAQSENPLWSQRALAHISSAPGRLATALRLIESDLPALQSVARPFFEGDNPEWSERVVALADSPGADARRFARELLERFPARVTPELLGFLAQHDDPEMQAFVAVRLETAPETGPAIARFDAAILNARGRSRRAKNSVQKRLGAANADENHAHPSNEIAVETLLDAARNGAPRDRAWALQQLVRAALDGAPVAGLAVEGAVARAARR